MTARLDVNGPMYREVWHHLLKGWREEAAFLFAEIREDRDETMILARESYLVRAEEFAGHSGYHVALKDEVQQRIIKRAWDTERALVELHVHHGTWPAAFSAVDVEGLLAFAPHVVWRLRRPYLALVVAESSFDALFWPSKDSLPLALDEMHVDEKTLRPTLRTLAALEINNDR